VNRQQKDIEWLKKLGQEQDIFYFKQFQVKDDRSTMKVGTDAVLLGIATRVDEAESILEVGTGCGVICLILAQRCNALIDAIEIDEESVAQARENIQESPWASRIRVIHSSLQDYLKSCRLKYDLVVSNPPFFSRSYKSYIERRNLSRHDDRLTFEELIEASRQLLTPSGQLWLVLPVREGGYFRNTALAAGLHLHHLIQIIPKKGKPSNRHILGFGKVKADMIERSELILRDNSNAFSEEYKVFAHEFYIDF
jgi:tRNA1Val (adenine37-N6)-methyltransferase